MSNLSVQSLCVSSKFKLHEVFFHTSHMEKKDFFWLRTLCTLPPPVSLSQNFKLHGIIFDTHIASHMKVFSQDLRSSSVLYGGCPLSVSHRQCVNKFTPTCGSSISENNNNNRNNINNNTGSVKSLPRLLAPIVDPPYQKITITIGIT